MRIGAEDGVDEFGAKSVRTASVMMSAATAKVIPMKEIHVITETPPSSRRARR